MFSAIFLEIYYFCLATLFVYWGVLSYKKKCYKLFSFYLIASTVQLMCLFDKLSR